MKRRLWIGVLAAAIVVALVTVALAWSYDAPRLGRAVLALLSTPSVHVTAERFRLSPLRGVELGDARVASDLPGGRLRIHADELVLRHRFWPLLTGRLIADELVIHSPRLELVTGASGPAQPAGRPPEREPSTTPAATAGRKEPELRIERVRIENGDLLLGTGDEATEIRGVDLEMRDLETAAPDAPLLGLRAQGSLTADEVRSGTVSGHDLAGTVELADGHLRFSDLQLEAEQGHFRLPSLDFDFGRKPSRYRFEVISDPLRTDRLLGVTAGGFGTGELRFQAAGAGEPADTFEGQGSLHLPGGSLPANPTLEAIAAFLGKDALIDRTFAPLEIAFRVDGDTVTLTPFDLHVEDILVRFSGSLRLTGPLDLRAVVEAPRERLDAKQVPHELLDALASGEGRVRLPLAIRGTETAPKVTPAEDLLLASGRTALRKRIEEKLGSDVGSHLGRQLDRLLGGGHDDDAAHENQPPPP